MFLSTYFCNRSTYLYCFSCKWFLWSFVWGLNVLLFVSTVFLLSFKVFLCNLQIFFKVLFLLFVFFQLILVFDWHHSVVSFSIQTEQNALFDLNFRFQFFLLRFWSWFPLIFFSIAERALAQLTSLEIATVEGVSAGGVTITFCIQSTLDPTVLLKLLHIQIFFSSWFDDWLLSFSFKLKVWSSKVRCSMKSLSCGKVCAESFHVHRGRKMIFLKINFVIHTNIPETVINAYTLSPRPY